MTPGDNRQMGDQMKDLVNNLIDTRIRQVIQEELARMQFGTFQALAGLQGQDQNQGQGNEVQQYLSTLPSLYNQQQGQQQGQAGQGPQTGQGGQGRRNGQQASIGEDPSLTEFLGKAVKIILPRRQDRQRGPAATMQAGNQNWPGGGNVQAGGGGGGGAGGDGQAMPPGAQQFAQVLAQANMEISQELQVNLKNLKQVIEESNSIARKIETLLGRGGKQGGQQ